jgi:hypothetical protein
MAGCAGWAGWSRGNHGRRRPSPRRRGGGTAAAHPRVARCPPTARAGRGSARSTAAAGGHRRAVRRACGTRPPACTAHQQRAIQGHRHPEARACGLPQARPRRPPGASTPRAWSCCRAAPRRLRARGCSSGCSSLQSGPCRAGTRPRSRTFPYPPGPQTSELLIRGFWVRAPGAPPTLTWSFIVRPARLRVR